MTTPHERAIGVAIEAYNDLAVEIWEPALEAAIDAYKQAIAGDAEMVIKVARAICVVQGWNPEDHDAICPAYWKNYVLDAKAALQAIAGSVNQKESGNGA